MTNTILAIDPGKFNSVLCHFDPNTRAASPRTVKTSPAYCGRNAATTRCQRRHRSLQLRGVVLDLGEELKLPCLWLTHPSELPTRFLSHPFWKIRTGDWLFNILFRQCVCTFHRLLEVADGAVRQRAGALPELQADR